MARNKARLSKRYKSGALVHYDLSSYGRPDERARAALDQACLERLGCDRAHGFFFAVRPEYGGEWVWAPITKTLRHGALQRLIASSDVQVWQGDMYLADQAIRFADAESVAAYVHSLSRVTSIWQLRPRLHKRVTREDLEFIPAGDPAAVDLVAETYDYLEVFIVPAAALRRRGI